MSINTQKLKNIIFDLGGVILNIDYYLTVEAFKQLGIDNFDQLFSQAKQTPTFDLYEKGLISSAEFRKEVNKIIGKEVDDKTFDAAWNSILLDLPIERLDLLTKAKEKYATFLLSNTTAIHIESFYSRLKKVHGIDNFSDYFHKVYLSFEVGMRKPDAEIFELVLSENNLKPEETLFIDDSIQHIESAQKLGIQTYWLDVKKENVIDLFELNNILL